MAELEAKTEPELSPEQRKAKALADCEEWLLTKAPEAFRKSFPFGNCYRPLKKDAKRFSEITEEEYAAKTKFAHNLRLCDQPEKTEWFRVFACDVNFACYRNAITKAESIAVIKKVGYVFYGDENEHKKMYPNCNSYYRHPDYHDDPYEHYGWDTKSTSKQWNTIPTAEELAAEKAAEEQKTAEQPPAIEA